jgi:hypothetical protein
LWTGVLAGPIAWAIDLLVRYSLVRWSCDTQHRFVLQIVACGALIVAAAGASAAWRGLLQTPADAPTEGGRPIDRSRFMALLGLLTSLLFATVIVAAAIPLWILDACR